MGRVSVLVAVLIASALVITGCGGDGVEGPETVEVTGVVSLDGNPVSGAHVTFSPKTSGPPGFAETDEEGNFTLRTLYGDGAIPGSYMITVTKTITQGGMEFEDERAYREYVDKHGADAAKPKIVEELPKKYGNRKTSGLAAEVAVGAENHFELKLEGK